MHPMPDRRTGKTKNPRSVDPGPSSSIWSPQDLERRDPGSNNFMTFRRRRRICEAVCHNPSSGNSRCLRQSQSFQRVPRQPAAARSCRRVVHELLLNRRSDKRIFSWLRVDEAEEVPLAQAIKVAREQFPRGASPGDFARPPHPDQREGEQAPGPNGSYQERVQSHRKDAHQRSADHEVPSPKLLELCPRKPRSPPPSSVCIFCRLVVEIRMTRIMIMKM